MGFKENFKPFLDSLEQCILTKNWFGALLVAVTLPDICVSVDGTQEKLGRVSKHAYIKWFDEYLDSLSRYGFMNGSNAYALR